MDLALISLKQVGIMFIMILLGFILVKLKLIDLSAKKSFSNLLVYLLVPCMIINSYNTTYDSSILINILWSFLASILLLFIGLIITFIITHFWEIDDKNILRFALIFSNAAYMGFPLIEAMFGKEGLIYASSFVSMFNILLWTIGYMIVSRSFNIKLAMKSIAKTPVLYALIFGLFIFFFQIKIPSLISSPLSLIGNMNTPLSMIITGMIIASSKIKPVLKNKYLWLTVITRLIIIPSICLFIILLMSKLNIDSNLLKIVFILEACPCAAITTIFAIKFNYNEDLAASSVVITTIFSIITLPLFTLLIGLII